MNIDQAKESIENESLLRQEAKSRIRKSRLPVTDNKFTKDIRDRSYDESIDEIKDGPDESNKADDRYSEKAKRTKRDLKEIYNREEKDNEVRLSKNKYIDKKNIKKDLSKKRRFIVSSDEKNDTDKKKKDKKLTDEQVRQISYSKKQLDQKKTVKKDSISEDDRTVIRKYAKSRYRHNAARLIPVYTDHAKYQQAETVL